MQFLKLASLLSLAALASANTVSFQSLDQIGRTIYFTGNAGLAVIEPVSVPGGQTVTVDIPEGWCGNFFSVSAGEPVVPGMLGEVCFQAWNGVNFFDVSAIVNPNDKNGVKELFPTGENPEPVSGCQIFPCNNAYYAPNDDQTKGTTSDDLTCTLGTATEEFLESRDAEHSEAPNFPRKFVERRW